MRWTIWCCSLLSIASTACSTYRLVEVDVRTDVTGVATPEVTRTDGYDARLAGSRNVVIRPPAGHREASSVPGGRDTPSSQTPPREPYGAWVTEMERAFVEQHFAVVSHRGSTAPARQEQTADEPAGLPGVDLIVQIEALEYEPDVSVAHLSQIDVRYFDTDGYGEKGQPVAMTQRDVDRITPQVTDLVDAEYEPLAHTAVLACKLIDARTGELLMLYRHQECRLQPGVSPHLTLQYLFRREEGRWSCVDTKPRAPEQGQPAPGSVTNEADAVGRRDAAARSRLDVVRTICRRFVECVRSPTGES